MFVQIFGNRNRCVMRVGILLMICYSLLFTCRAQSATEPGINDFIFVDQEPVPQNMGVIRDSIGYPQVAADSGIQGTVIARVLVNPEGNYVKHKIISKTDSMLNVSVENYISGLVFSPASLEGKAVPFWINVPFIFRLVTEENSAQAAIAIFSQRLSENPEDYVTWMQRGLQYKEMGQYEAAVADFSTSLAYNPITAAEGSSRAEISTALATETDTSQAFSDSMYLSMQYEFFGLYARGTTYGSLGKYDSATLDLTQAIEVGTAIPNPDSSILATLPTAYTERGYVKFLQGKHGEALEDYQFVIANTPGLACSVYPLIAELYLSQDDYRNIVQTYDKMIECNPDDELLRYSRGYYKTELGEFESAVADLDFAAEKSVNSNLRIASHNRKAWALYKVEKYDEALAAVQDAINVNVLGAQSQYYKGLIVLAQENKTLACESFNKSIDYGIGGTDLEEVKKLLSENCQ